MSGWRRGGPDRRRAEAAGRLHPGRQRLDRGDRPDLTTLEVLAAPGAQGPVEADEPRAVRADPVEPRPTGRADDPFLVDAPLARRAVLDRLDLGEQRLLGQVPLPDLADLLVRPDDLVDPDREDEEDGGQQDDPGGDEVRQDHVVGSLLHVAERPVGGGDPEDDEVGPDRQEGELDDRALDEVVDRLADPVEDLIHELGVASVRRSAPAAGRASGDGRSVSAMSGLSRRTAVDRRGAATRAQTGRAPSA